MEHKLIGMYIRQKNQVFDQWMRDRRDRFGENLGLTRQDGIRPALRALKQGFHFLYFPDMDYGPEDAIFVPFFGIPAATITATSRMAKAAGAAILPVTIRMTWHGYEVAILPPWPNYPSGDDAADARQLNAWIESLVPSMPEQYFWVHKRFKTRPPGVAKVY
jgi:KDO2-lipid IV(A) lauroyltransferase